MPSSSPGNSISNTPSDDSGVVDDSRKDAGKVTVSSNGDRTGGIIFQFFLGDALGYDQMTRTEKLSLFKNELILGCIVACAQIPESVAFSFLARVEPSIAIHSAWIMGLICSLFGGRPGMVNGATGAFAAIISTFIKEPSEPGRSGEGVETLFVSVMVAGVLMLIAFALNLGRFVKIISYPIMLGFCNGLAIVIGLAQLHAFSYTCNGGNRRCPTVNETDTNMTDSNTTADSHHHYIAGAELGWMIGIVLISMIVMEFVPKIPHKAAKFVPSPLLAILVAVLIEFAIVRQAGSRTDTIGDVAPFSKDTAFPIPFFIDNSRYPAPEGSGMGNMTVLGPKKFDFDNLKGKGGQILLGAFLLAVVGLIESLLTQEVVDKFTKTKGNGRRTIAAMGAGNIISGLLGGMGGNAMIGSSTINCLNGGRGRLAPTVTALVVMIMVMGAYPVLNYVPVASLVGIMFVVVLHTFKWHSVPAILAAAVPERLRLKYNFLYKIDRMDVLVVLIVTIATYFLNLAYAIFLGVGFASLVFAWRSSQVINVRSEIVKDDLKVYYVDGPLFFGNASQFADWFDVDGDPVNVEAHFQGSKLFDSAATKVLNTIAKMYSRADKKFIVRRVDAIGTRSVYKASRLLHYIELAGGEDVPIDVLDSSDDKTPIPIVGSVDSVTTKEVDLQQPALLHEVSV